MAFKNTPSISLVSLPTTRIIAKHHHPYIGQYGPIKNPRFINLCLFHRETHTSINQPKKE